MYISIYTSIEQSSSPFSFAPKIAARQMVCFLKMALLVSILRTSIGQAYVSEYFSID